MTNEQVEHIATRVAEIARNAKGNLRIQVIPPSTTATGHLQFAFAVEDKPQYSATEGEPETIVRIL